MSQPPEFANPIGNLHPATIVDDWQRCHSIPALFVGQPHLRNVGVSLLCFASRDVSRAKSYATQFNGVDAFGSYEAAAPDSRIEALYICTPHHLHLKHARIAARSN